MNARAVIHPEVCTHRHANSNMRRIVRLLLYVASVLAAWYALVQQQRDSSVVPAEYEWLVEFVSYGMAHSATHRHASTLLTRVLRP